MLKLVSIFLNTCEKTIISSLLQIMFSFLCPHLKCSCQTVICHMWSVGCICLILIYIKEKYWSWATNTENDPNMYNNQNTGKKRETVRYTAGVFTGDLKKLTVGQQTEHTETMWHVGEQRDGFAVNSISCLRHLTKAWHTESKENDRPSLTQDQPMKCS